MIISASLEGAAPEQLETEVARKLEDKLTSLRLLQHVTTLITEGSVTLSVAFAIDKDGNEALNEVRNAVDSAKAELPASLDTPSVSRLTTSTSALLTYVVEAPRMNEEALSWFIDNELSKQLLAVRGVAKVVRGPGHDGGIGPERERRGRQPAGDAERQLRWPGRPGQRPASLAYPGGARRSGGARWHWHSYPRRRRPHAGLAAVGLGARHPCRAQYPGLS